MSLPNSYTVKAGAIPDYLEGILGAEAPERFSYKFLEGLGFASSNDRQLIGILKELGFLNADGAPIDRYFRFLDRSSSEKVLAEGIREAYSDLFAVNIKANELSAEETYNKLRTLYKGEKKDTVIKLVSKTFRSLCDYADFSHQSKPAQPEAVNHDSGAKEEEIKETAPTGKVSFGSLQYQINIVLPDSRDQAVFDAIFKSMRDHLG